MLYSIGFDKREDSVSFFIREIEADKNVRVMKRSCYP